MYDQVANNTFSYVLTLDEMKKSYEYVSWPKLITITMVANANSTIDTTVFKSNMETLRLKIANTESEGFTWKIRDTKFYNQITMSCTCSHSTKSVKIFSNGSIQVAGCTDLFDCRRVIHQIVKILKRVMDIDVSIDTFRICMINANFQFNRYVNLRKCVNHFGKHTMFKVAFSEDKYAAVKIKFKPADDMKQITASIFNTGKIIISGAQNLKEIAFGYNIIIKYIELNNEVMEEENDNKQFDEILGFKINDLVKTLKDKGFRSWIHTEVSEPINFLPM